MTLYAFGHFEEVHIGVLIAMLGRAVALVVLGILAAYLVNRMIHGIRVYFRFRGTRLVTCPETYQVAVVEVSASSMVMQAILDKPCLRLSECSRWPMRGADCAQDCLRQIEAHPSKLRITGACRCCHSLAEFAAHHCPRCHSLKTFNLSKLTDEDLISFCDSYGLTFDLRETVLKYL